MYIIDKNIIEMKQIFTADFSVFIAISKRLKVQRFGSNTVPSIRSVMTTIKKQLYVNQH